MPVLAPVFAAIGASVFAETAIGVAISGAIGGAMGGAVAGAIGGALGGALGGGINSVMQGGQFWDGAKGGALGGAIGGGVAGAGGFEGIMESISGGAGDVATEAAIPYLAEGPTTGFEQTLANTINPAEVVSADKFALPSLSESVGGGSLISPELDPGAIAGSAPKIAQNLGSTTAAQTMGSAGSQNALARMFEPLKNQNPYEVAGGITGYFNQGQKSRDLKESLAGIRDRGTSLYNMKTGAYNQAADRATMVQNRVNDLFAKYGIVK